MTSSNRPPVSELFVWVWLPGAEKPVVAGRLYRDSNNSNQYNFNYGNRYLERSDAIPLYAPELPLRRGRIDPPAGMPMAGSLRDGSPDAWGRRVIIHRLVGKTAPGTELDELTYMIGYKYLNDAEVLQVLANRPESQSVVVTGRGGGSELQAIMDTVSEVKDVKHAYKAGIKARKGVDY